MALDPDDVDRIFAEVMSGKEPTRPDSAEEAKFRKDLKADIEKMQRDGLVIDYPGEWPDVD